MGQLSPLSIEADAAERDSNIIIEQQLAERLAAVEDAAKADVVAYLGPMFPPADDQVKDAVEAISPRKKGKPRGKALMVILETGGGYIDLVESIARIFRHHYRSVEFAVPSFAMSAGTILVMSGDAIHMDYASVLGPIDPQVRKPASPLPVPALGYLEKFDRLVEKSAKGELTTAELHYLVSNFDPAEMYRYEQERELSIALLEEWLVKFKFKDWKRTETRKQKVTKAMKKERAKKIGERLNETGHWHSHSRGIPAETLRRDLKLLIGDFDDQPIGPPIRNYYRLLRDYQMRRGHWTSLIHTKEGYVGYEIPGL